MIQPNRELVEKNQKLLLHPSKRKGKKKINFTETVSKPLLLNPRKKELLSQFFVPFHRAFSKKKPPKRDYKR